VRVRGEFWQQVLEGGARVPADKPLDDLTHELFEMLGDPDPQIRDSLAYPVLATWIGDGVYDELLAGLGDGACVGLSSRLGDDGDDSVFRRSFSALVLADVVNRANITGTVSPSHMLTWGDRAMTWFTRENDLRGFVAGKGWAHAVAHGADLLGQFARSFHFGVHELTVLLDVVADRRGRPARLHRDDRAAPQPGAGHGGGAVDLPSRLGAAPAARCGGVAVPDRVQRAELPARAAPAAGGGRAGAGHPR
jgi:hypothetical protein